MAANPPDPQDTEQDWHKRQSAGSAFGQILIAGLVLGGGVFLYYRHTQTKKHIYEVDKAGKEMLVRDNPKDLLAARDRFGEALALDGADPFGVSSTALAEVLLSGDYGIAAEAANAEKFVDQAEQVNAPIDEHFTAKALSLLNAHKYEDAESYIKAVQAKGGLPAGLANALGRLRHQQGKLDEARAYLKKAQDIAWRNPRFAADLAQSYFDDGDYINATTFYEKALDASSQHLRSMVGLARARIARGQDLKKASDDLDTVQALPAGETSPTLTALALTARSELRRFEQKQDEALKLAEQAVAADPKCAWAQAARGNALADKGDAKADEAFKTAITLDGHVGVFYFDAAKAMAKLKDSAKAEGYMGQYAKAMKVDDRYHLVYGDLLKGLGNADKAAAEYTAAIAANGFNAKAHYALGTVLQAKDKLPEAEKEFQAALAAQKNFPEAQVQLGNIKFAGKKFEDALEDFASALVQMKTANVERAQIDALLDDVTNRLVKANQKPLSKAWVEQAKQLVR
jgi:tetratricopeptide (TPR) repeat protein